MRESLTTPILARALALAALVPAAALADVVRTPVAVHVTPKPDLTVVTARAERTGVTAEGAHRVRISATVRCAAARVPVTCTAFKILAEWRDGAGAWTRLGEAGVASLSSGGPALARIPTETRSFDDTVPSGRTRTYRLTVDSGSRVTETNEDNNQATATYRATGCMGSDLVLTRVDMQRVRDGALVHVWVRNRCLEPCVADLVYVIDEREAFPGGTGVEQGIGGRVDGETEVGPLGNVVAGGRGGDVTYTVRVEARGGTCRDSSLANNSCRVTLPDGVDSRRFDCNR